MLKSQTQRKDAIPGQGKHKGGAAAKAVGIGAEQAGADKQAKEGGGGECRLVGDTEHALRSGMEDAFGD
ncbi:hypothetical protein D3C76_1093150 [compost metagenome]